ncbi:Uncharacterised protein [Mycobacteroides abscessus subsp. abscessus]|nr:Uncharacterised protein [Mycobacteroides abscessus subsp. abscessus]
MCRLLPRCDRQPSAAQHGDHQPAAITFGGADEGLLGVVGVAGLAAERARVVVQQLVVVRHLIGRMVIAFTGFGGVAGERGLGRRDQVGEGGVGERVFVEQAEVVGRGAHAGAVET